MSECVLEGFEACGEAGIVRKGGGERGDGGDGGGVRRGEHGVQERGGVQEVLEVGESGCYELVRELG